MFERDARGKLESSKRKILSRKYGYMFYRKAISSVLPSQVEKLHETNRKKRTFAAWKTLWFDERAGWRLTIRANLHYAYTLKRSAFKKWQLQLVRKKTERIQCQIASAYYTRKLKRKFFGELLYYVKCYKQVETLRKISVESFVLRRLTLEVINLHYGYVELEEKYYLQEFVSNKTKRRCFTKLLDHANEQIQEKNNLLRARLLFKSKNYPGMLRPFFTKWRSHAARSASKKFKLHLALDHFRSKILRRGLLKLYRYRNYRRVKRLAKEVYETNLKAKSLRCLREFTVRKIEKRIRMNEAREFYARKITRERFDLLVRYKKHRRRKKDVLLKIEARLEHKIKEKTLRKLKNYRVACKTKKANVQIAVGHYEYKIKRVCFEKFTIFCREREAINDKKIRAVSAKREKGSMRICFSHWKLFCCFRMQKRIKISLAVRKYKAKQLSKTLVALKQHATQQKSDRKARETRLANSAVTKWKEFVERRILYGSKLQKAKLIYELHLVKKGLSAILKAAYKKQEFRKKRVLKLVEHRLDLAGKYFTIWKRKVTRKGNVLFNEDHRRENKRKVTDEMATCVKPFVWNDLCFEKPKIPDYLLKSIQHL